jgi:hypothetical protein
MPVGTLTGYALKMSPPIAEHTYVTSSHGHVWPCWGRFQGGRVICFGSGNTDQADCLSNSHSKLEAGIRYGKSGVCHQTANRIMLPAGQTVFNALHSNRGSLFAWGTYGREHPSGIFKYFFVFLAPQVRYR